jgi:putative phosphoribosyl transferase
MMRNGYALPAARFVDRRGAGLELARALSEYAGRPGLLVLALPRGGVPVGAEVAKALRAQLDLVVVRKLGAPGQRELAMGAIASGGVRVLNQEVIGALALSDAAIEAAAAEEARELARRERAYRGDRPPPEVRGGTVIVVDDGIATGSTIRAAARAVRAQKPARLILAAPVADPSVVASLRSEADDVVCPVQPSRLYAIGLWYQLFPQVTDDEVRGLLEGSLAPGETARASRLAR